jgi:hypothetical protein
MATDTSEAGLEKLICRALTGTDCEPRPACTPPVVAEPTAPYGGAGWLPGDPVDYDREYCVDLVQLSAFLRLEEVEYPTVSFLRRSRSAFGVSSGYSARGSGSARLGRGQSHPA